MDRARSVGQAYDLAQEQELSGTTLWQSGRSAARDLAGVHRAAALNCVSCHRGDNDPSDRATALTLAARSSLLYLSGQFDPDHVGLAQADMVESSCLRCHVDQPSLGGVAHDEQNPVLVESFDNHFHFYPFGPQYVSRTAVGCLDCHPSHLEIPPIAPYFIEEEGVVLPACVQCHIDVEKSPVDLQVVAAFGLQVPEFAI